MKTQLLTKRPAPAGSRRPIPDLTRPANCLPITTACVFPDPLISAAELDPASPLPFIPVPRQCPGSNPRATVRGGDKALVTWMIGGSAEQILVVPETFLPMPEGLTFDEGAGWVSTSRPRCSRYQDAAQTAPGEVVGVPLRRGRYRGSRPSWVAKAIRAPRWLPPHRTGADELLKSLAPTTSCSSPTAGVKAAEFAPRGRRRDDRPVRRRRIRRGTGGRWPRRPPTSWSASQPAASPPSS